MEANVKGLKPKWCDPVFFSSALNHCICALFNDFLLMQVKRVFFAMGNQLMEEFVYL